MYEVVLYDSFDGEFAFISSHPILDLAIAECDRKNKEWQGQGNTADHYDVGYEGKIVYHGGNGQL